MQSNILQYHLSSSSYLILILLLSITFATIFSSFALSPLDFSSVKIMSKSLFRKIVQSKLGVSGKYTSIFFTNYITFILISFA